MDEKILELLQHHGDWMDIETLRRTIQEEFNLQITVDLALECLEKRGVVQSNGRNWIAVMEDMR